MRAGLVEQASPPQGYALQGVGDEAVRHVEVDPVTALALHELSVGIEHVPLSLVFRLLVLSLDLDQLVHATCVYVVERDVTLGLCPIQVLDEAVRRRVQIERAGIRRCVPDVV